MAHLPTGEEADQMSEMVDPAEELRAEPKTMVNIIKRAIIYGFNTMPRPPHGLGCGDLGDWMYEQVARGVLAKMREPTATMAAAPYNADLDIYWSYTADGRPGGASDVWRTMIDAELGTPPD